MKKVLAIALALLVCTVVFAAGFEVFGGVIPYAVYGIKGADGPTDYAGGVVFGFDKVNDNGFWFGAQLKGIYSAFINENVYKDSLTIIPEVILGKTVYYKDNFYISLGAGVGAGMNYHKGESDLFEILTTQKPATSFDLSAEVETGYVLTENIIFTTNLSMDFAFGAADFAVGGLLARIGLSYYI